MQLCTSATKTWNSHSGHNGYGLISYLWEYMVTWIGLGGKVNVILLSRKRPNSLREMRTQCPERTEAGATCSGDEILGICEPPAVGTGKDVGFFVSAVCPSLSLEKMAILEDLLEALFYENFSIQPKHW